MLSYLSAAMKSNRGKSTKPLEFFFRERLVKKADRAALNTALNEITLALKGNKDKRIRQAPSAPRGRGSVSKSKENEAVNKSSSRLGQVLHTDKSSSIAGELLRTFDKVQKQNSNPNNA
jgi:hypothetical protein